MRKKRYISMLIIFTLLIAVVYLWSGKKEESEAYNTIYHTQLSKDVEFLVTTIMLNSIPDTFKLYSNDFTKNEYILFKNSLQNINRELSVASANIEKIEYIEDREHKLSGSIEELYDLFFEIEKNAENIDENVFFKISEITPEYSKKLSAVFYQSSNIESIFKNGPNVLEEMNQEIEELIR